MHFDDCSDMAQFLCMLMNCKATHRTRWCQGDDPPCWSVELNGVDDYEGAQTSFCFNADGSIQSVFVG
jgi:hypothetical protein